VTRRLAVVGLATLGLIGLFAFGLLRGPPDRAIASNLLGRPAPSFALPTYETYWGPYGERLELSEHLGERPILINFWASWCPPCRDEAPHLEAAWRAYGDRVLFVGVHTQDRGRQDAGRAFLQEFGLSFPNVYDAESAVSIDYGVFGMPETFFVGRDGVVRYKHIGPLTPDTLRQQLEALL
jgi:cytochrome c biogenesis protein CcmG, thiol:disulfide interchange protein DsbE